MLLFSACGTPDVGENAPTVVHSPVAFVLRTATHLSSPRRLRQDLKLKHGLSSYCTCLFYLPPSSDCDAVKEKSVLLGQRAEFPSHVPVLALKISSPIMPFIFYLFILLPSLVIRRSAGSIYL